MPTPTGNVLYYGDNLDVLRRYIKDATVDLVYLDPPFNSNANYNVLFAEQDGTRAAAQVTAFEDTWHWDQAASAAYEEVVEQGGRIADALRAMRTLLGDSDMLAYLAMMAPRLVELRRVLKPTGSIYLHCDPTASHYLKLLMDGVFGSENFRNEIIWSYRRYTAKSSDFQRLHDTIFRYTRSGKWVFNDLREPYADTAGARDSHYKKDSDGRWYRWQKRAGQDPYKIYLNEQGKRIGDVWALPHINASAAERLGYPTQKPLALLERIIEASSNPGDLVLDPFCGCGTAVAAAQRLGRQWIGIDITHLAVNLMKHRLTKLQEERPDMSISYQVIGEPTDLAGAQELAASDPYQFQWWALGLVGARPVDQKKGADQGIDGRRFFHDEQGGTTKQVIYSVKAGQVHVTYVRDLCGVVVREEATIGVLISMEEPTGPMRSEAASAGFYTDPWGAKHPRIQLFTIADLLDGKKPDITNSLTGDTTLRRVLRAGRPVRGGQKGSGPSNLSLFSADDLEPDAPDTE